MGHLAAMHLLLEASLAHGVGGPGATAGSTPCSGGGFGQVLTSLCAARQHTCSLSLAPAVEHPCAWGGERTAAGSGGFLPRVWAALSVGVPMTRDVDSF